MNLIEVCQSDELPSLKEQCIPKTISSHPPSPISATAHNIFSEPQLFPRLGDEYQVEIPPMLTGLECLLPMEFSSHIGLAIPITWMKSNKIGEQKKFCRENVLCASSSNIFDVNHLIPSSIKQKAEIFENSLDCINANMSLACQNNPDICCSPLPESQASCWSDAEIQSFLLCLYIFGKNLVQVKKFMGCKDMKDILSFYYGKFYRSDAHRRWADCRKTRTRKCIQGHRLFTGWRQQQLLSCLLPAMSNEAQHSLLEATRTFNEGRSSLEDLVFTMKAAVGIDALIEAVGIGKGKYDLTTFIMDPNRTNQSSNPRLEIPSGKACSAFASTDIIKFLTGDFRLSKARSHDLFWEAVWPRLLARGWHSERPRNFCTKSSLVFLIPGIRKFSRRRLVKGDHYFDSVTDVLNKVASNPRLLDLEPEVEEENGTTKDLSSYLKPRFPKYNADNLKFTVVDTSLGACPANSFKLREIRSLRFEEIGHHEMEKKSSDSSTEQSTDASSNDKGSSEEVSVTNSLQGNKPENLPNCSSLDGKDDHLAPLVKRQRLSACKQAMRNGCHKLLFEEKADSAMDSMISIVDGEEKKPQRILFDLNLPQFPPDFDSGMQQNGPLDGRRQSVRNRPLTVKAIEAVAGGFLNSRPKGRCSKKNS